MIYYEVIQPHVYLSTATAELRANDVHAKGNGKFTVICSDIS